MSFRISVQFDRGEGYAFLFGTVETADPSSRSAGTRADASNTFWRPVLVTGAVFEPMLSRMARFWLYLFAGKGTLGWPKRCRRGGKVTQ